MLDATKNPAVLSPAKRFRLKAAECLQHADVAKHPEAREAFKKLAVNYEKLAIHAESVDRKLKLTVAQKPA